MKSISSEEVLCLILKIDSLLDEYHQINVPTGFPIDISNRAVENLKGIRSKIVFQNNSNSFRFMLCEEAKQLCEALGTFLLALRDVLPEECYKDKNMVIVAPEPAVVKFSASGPKIVITEQREFSFEKTIRFCGYFFPKKFREEAKGDITETRQEMLEGGSSKLTVNLVSSFKIICFILSSLRIRWSDWVDSEKERNK